MRDSAPRVVIVGGGFGGLAAAKALRKTDARVVLIDRQNHHLFQPLLYQVATSVLSPAQIASPIRGILRRQRNTTVILGEVTGVDSDRRRVFVDSVDREGVALEYDYLILATGASHSYFGHDEFAQFAPGLKSLADAVSIRNQILRAFEQAEAEEDPKRHARSVDLRAGGRRSHGRRDGRARWRSSCAARSDPSSGASIPPRHESSWSTWPRASSARSPRACRPRRGRGWTSSAWRFGWVTAWSTSTPTASSWRASALRAIFRTVLVPRGSSKAEWLPR